MTSAPGKLRVLALEPYEALSHRLFLEGLARHSRHAIEVAALPARAWKWRMRTSALHYALELPKREPPDLLFVSDYLNLAELVALLPERWRSVPVVVYFHENQLTYPLQETERRDHHFALTHLYAIRTARRAFFNSRYHREGFLAALDALLDYAPDVDLEPTRRELREKSDVLPLGTDLPKGEPRGGGEPPVILWHHRWEYDKDPSRMVETVLELRDRGADFRLMVLGQSFRKTPDELDTLRVELGDRLVACGFLPDRNAYAEALTRADITFSTALHEFFGLGTLEALRSGAVPVLPDDLAYGELLPKDLHDRFLYSRASGPLEPLQRALRAVQSGQWTEERRALVDFTDRFAWEVVAPRFDAMFEECANEPD